MSAESIAVVDACSRAAISGKLTFPQIVGRLMEAGVERYHVDYCRQESTYYWPDGQSHVAASPRPPLTIATDFSATVVQSAVRQSQRNEHSYSDFVRKTMAAGCVGYFVQITGRQAQYFGRKGECHVELFPSAPNSD